MVQSVNHIIDLIIADIVEISAFREILAYQPIHIFIEASLPRAVRVGKVHLGL